jgi:hypothetical protein
MTNTNSAVSTIPPAFSAEGWHRARAIGFVEIGTIFIATRWQHRIRITWELPFDQRQFDEQDPAAIRPKLISHEYASNLYGKSHLKKHLLQWIGDEGLQKIIDCQQNGRPFDPYIFIGEICQIKLRHVQKEKTLTWFEEVEDVYAILQEQTIKSFPPQITTGKVLTYEDWDEGAWTELSDYVKNRMRSSQEYRRKFGSDEYSDIPAPTSTRQSAPDKPIF